MQDHIWLALRRCHQSIVLFRPLGDGPLSPKRVLLCLLLFLLIPTHPLQGKAAHWLELIDRVEGGKINRIIGIYSVLKSHGTAFSEETAWAVAETIHQEGERYSLDPMLILAVIKVESCFQHAAVSAKGARGLMQIRPLVAQALAEEIAFGDWDGAESLDDPHVNIRIGVLYLSRLKERFKDLKVALAAYNWGPTKIQSRLKARKAIPWRYPTKVLSVYNRYRTQYEAA